MRQLLSLGNCGTFAITCRPPTVQANLVFRQHPDVKPNRTETTKHIFPPLSCKFLPVLPRAAVIHSWVVTITVPTDQEINQRILNLKLTEAQLRGELTKADAEQMREHISKSIAEIERRTCLFDFRGRHDGKADSRHQTAVH